MPPASRPPVDFGQRADDYERHRPGFPPGLFDRVRAHGLGVPGQRVLDLGAGTGTLARGFAARGGRVVGLDPSPEMLAGAARLARAEGRTVAWARAWAERTPFADRAFDVVCAGQCWHWFDRPRAARELARLLAPGGRALIAYFSYLADAGTPGAATEAVVLRHHPEWAMAGGDGREPQFAADLEAAGLRTLEVFEFDLEVAFTHASWRGRMRACNGVFRMPPERAAAFDAELARLLAGRYPDPFTVPHRVFGIVAG